MFRKSLFTLFSASLLACGGADEFVDSFEDSADGPDFAEDLEFAPAGSELVPEAVDPNPEEEDDEPGGRITFMGEEDGDLVIHASISSHVADQFPGADRYEVRLGAASGQSIVTIIGENGELLERLDLRQGDSDYFGADHQAMKVYSPLPWLPELTNCTFAPCPTLPTWPQGAELPDHIEVSTDGHSQRIRGSIGETELALELYPTGDGYELLPGNEKPGEVATVRLMQMTHIVNDIATLEPEVENVDDCWDCIFYGFVVSGAVSLCGNTLSPYICEDAGEGVDAFLEECPGACKG